MFGSFTQIGIKEIGRVLKMIRIIISILLFMSLIAVIVNPGFGKEKKCSQQVAVKNPHGDKKFGAIWTYPGKIQPSVWFPIVPRAISIDSKGNIYVGDSVNYRVLKFNNKGDFLFEFRLQPAAKTTKPEISYIIHDIGIDKDDNVYVMNSFEDRVEIYGQNGRFKESVSSNDFKQEDVFEKIPKGRFSKYIYEINSYHKEPAGLLYSITVLDDGKVVSMCKGAELAADEDGEIYSFDYNGKIYTFDGYLNVIKINPFGK